MEYVGRGLITGYLRFSYFWCTQRSKNSCSSESRELNILNALWPPNMLQVNTDHQPFLFQNKGWQWRTVEDPRQLNRSLSQCPFLLERRGWQWGILIEDGNGRKGPSFLYRRILYSAPDPSLICPRRWTQLHWKQQQCNTKYTQLFHTAVILHIGWRSIMRNRRGRHRPSGSHSTAQGRHRGPR